MLMQFALLRHMKKMGVGQSLSTYSMKNFQVTQGIKQKYGEELHVFCILTEHSICLLYTSDAADE